MRARGTLLPMMSFVIASALRLSWNDCHHRGPSALHPTSANNDFCFGNIPIHQKYWSPSYGVPPLYATPTEESDNVDDKKGGSGKHVNIFPSRCSSRDAASIIKKSSSCDGLLIITCDASGRGGGSKHDGIASILRIRHGASALQCNRTSQFNSDGKEDVIDVTARRTVPSRTSSEVAAIALGMKRALRTVPPSCRRQVLILSDSEYALDFFCGNEDKILNEIIANPVQRSGNQRKKRKGTSASSKNRGKRQTTQSVENREDAHRRYLLSLMNETPNGILFSKVRSSSRGVAISSSMIGSATIDDNDEDVDISWDGIGFIDHDAADHLSSITRAFANSYDGDEKEFGVSDLAYPLGKDDIAWLENSADITTTTSNNDDNDSNGLSSDFWRTMEVVGSDARQDRLERNRRRTEIIEEMLGSSSLIPGL